MILNMQKEIPQIHLNFFHFELILYLQKSYKNYRNFPCTLQPPCPDSNIVCNPVCSSKLRREHWYKNIKLYFILITFVFPPMFISCFKIQSRISHSGYSSCLLSPFHSVSFSVILCFSWPCTFEKYLSGIL